MVDVHTPAQRSRNMSAIRSGNNKSTEIAFLKLLRKEKITGWRRRPKQLIGKPDFVFPKKKIIVFIDGCFWHGCSKCYIAPKSNIKYWEPKIKRNKARDKEVNKLLHKNGWKVCHIWEHSLRSNSEKALKRIRKVLVS